MEEKTTLNKMGAEPIPKLMLAMGIPMIFSMVVQALYNIVDSYFVSNMPDTAQLTGVGEYAMNALALAFPVQMLIVALGVGTGVGINALLSRCLGQGDRKKASHVAGNALFVGICTYLVFLLFGLFGVGPYLRSQTTDAVVLGMGGSYLRICTTLSFGIVLFTMYEKILQGTGRVTPTVIAQVSGAVCNMILDPILIFGYFGLPSMGIEGAAYATVIGQVLSLVLNMIFHYGFNKDIDPHPEYMKPDGKIIKEIYQIGIPAIIMQALMSFMTYGVNIIFGMVSSASVTAYGMYYKIQQFVFFAGFGLNNTIIPVVSFNYGKQDKKRVQDGIKYGILYTVVIMVLGAVFLQIFANPLIALFHLSSETQQLCILSIRIITIGYIFAAANIAYQAIFQALGYGVSSLILSMLRLVIFALPLAWIFTRMENAQTLIWAAFPIAEAAAFVVALFMMKKIRRERIQTMGGSE